MSSTRLSSYNSTKPRVLAVIPARYASSRFPGKPLVDIQGKPMIQHVWDRVLEVGSIHKAVVATDDERIAEAVRGFGGEVSLTSPSHPSGTDRVWEVAKAMDDYDWVLNVQGDEPFMNPAHLQAAIDGIERFPSADIITLVTPIDNLQAWQDPNLVKAVLAQSGQALYFSRASVPFHRDQPTVVPDNAYRHLGLYLYRRDSLKSFTQLKPSPLEEIEKLEQLRALEAGMAIFAVEVEEAPIGVDTPEDLIRILDSESKDFTIQKK